MIEFLGAMTALDFLLILLWIGIIFYGVRAGMVKIIFLMASIIVGAIAGTALARPASHLTGPWAGVSADRGLAVTYFGITLLITLVMFIVLTLTYRRTNVARNPTVEAILGGITGVIGGLIAVAQLTGMMVISTGDQWAYFDGARSNIRLELQNTPFLPLLSNTFPTLTTTIDGWLPYSSATDCDHCLIPAST